MKKKLCLAIMLVLYAGLLSAPAQPPPNAPTVEDPLAWVPLFPKDIARVKSGKIIARNAPKKKGQKSTRVLSAFIVDTGMEEAYRILRETEKQIEYTKVVQEIEILERTDSYEVVRLKVKFLKGSLTYYNRREWDDEKFRIWWELDPSYKSDFVRLNGYYQLYYINDDHTLVRYASEVILRRIVPLSVQQAIIRYDLPNGLEDVRKRINSHGTYIVERKGDG